MADWKETAVEECGVLEKQRSTLLDAEEKDLKLVQKRAQIDRIMLELDELSKPYNAKIDDIDVRIEEIHESFVKNWDIIGKTYECEAGTVTLRTTKALKIVDKKRLITTLLDIGKLPEAIRSWNLSYLRKLKDVDMIENAIAHYDGHQTVIIKGAGDK
jgi:hypothetical protein